jgi:hypothetical protein
MIRGLRIRPPHEAIQLLASPGHAATTEQGWLSSSTGLEVCRRPVPDRRIGGGAGRPREMARVGCSRWHDIDVSDCWVRRSWLAHCTYLAELEAEHATIAACADQQHAWVMIGDDHGVYGAFPPAVTH